MFHVFIIDDNQSALGWLENVILKKGYQTSIFSNIEEAMACSQSERAEVVLMNSKMIQNNNGPSLQQLHSLPSIPEVIVLAENGSIEEAENAIEQGAWDYIVNPKTPQAIISALAQAFKFRQKKQPAHSTKKLKINFPGIVGKSAQLKSCLDTLSKASHSDANVLITGETGTGKELFASALHENSNRCRRSFVVVDCAALPKTLVESTLFGHEKGSFTGATQKQSGLIRQADGGTLFLDEVGELSLSLQKRFLRVLEERQFRMIGGKEEIKSNFRLVAATNRDLDAMVAQKQFREDLLFRLRTFGIKIPPIRTRKRDIEPLVLYCLSQCRKKKNPACEKSVSRDYFKALRKYDWPGNVRELFHAVERSLASAEQHTTLYPYHLPVYIRIAIAKASLPQSLARKESLEELNGVQLQEPTTIVHAIDVRQNLQVEREKVLRKAEDMYLRELLLATEGNISEAIETSGLSRSRFYQLLKDYDIRPAAIK